MSKYNYEFDMQHTDNPYIDLIVNCVKILGMNAVIKNENQALHYEDARSATASAKLIKYKDGYWNYTKDGDYCEEGYMEWNSYYRMLNGLPPAYTQNDELAYLSAMGYGDEAYEDIGIAYIIPELYRKYFIDVGDYVDEYAGKYVHELNTEELAILESDGTLDKIREDYTDTHYQYLYHLGDKRVDFYTARKANNFTLLWLPKLNTFDIIENKFRRMYERNRQYTMSTVYSEAYRFMSYHYDAFIQILIIIQTMVDMISEVQEYIINKDVFDSRTIRYLFESYGIAYYKEIPVKYQIRIIKNVNTLLKYKSSHRNITDILELFDDDTIVVYTYYLMKTKAVSRDNFFYITADDVNPKYNTNTTYYIGRPEDISNNKVPLMSVNYNEDEPNFIQSHVYGYDVEEDKIDISDNREINSVQPIAGKIADSLNSLTQDTPPNSFICEFLTNSATVDDGTGWFGMEKYNKNTQKNKYLEQRNAFLVHFRNELASLIKSVFDDEIAGDETFALNQFHCKRIKYKIYSILGIFNDDGLTDYDNVSDSELLERFYQTDEVLDKDKCSVLGIPESFIDSDNGFVLNHTIPFMCHFDYRNKARAVSEDDVSSSYIFNDNASFSATPNYFSADMYAQWTKKFREDYYRAVKLYVEAVFDDMAYDYVNNPTPRYVGWMDLAYVIEQTGKPINEFELGMEVTTKGYTNIPIYTTAYVYEVITEDMIGQEYFRKNYDLCFLKVPILDPNAYKVLERVDMRRSYDAITLSDPFWDGVTTFDILTDDERDALHQSKKQEILNKEFTIERTKYLGVEASIDLTKMSYQVSYFMNMLYDKHMDEEGLYVEVDELIAPTKVRLNDLLTFAIALNYIYNGVEPDNIASDMEKNMYINGFNFDTDWNDIYNYLQNKHVINHNYNNDIHEYTYTNEFGETITNIGYGMSPMGQGWLTEKYDDWIVYDAANDIKEYAGRPIYGYNDNGGPIYYYEDEANKPTGNPINDPFSEIDETAIPDPSIGAFLSGRYEQCDEDCITSYNFDLDFGSSAIWNYNLKNHVVSDFNGVYRTFSIAWEPTQYPSDDNNSHGLWLNTAILTMMNDDEITDTERINMLKKIYYSNTNLYDHLTYMLRHAESKRMYDIYKVLFDSFMETKMNHDYYGLIDENGKPVYTDKDDESIKYYITTLEEIIVDNDGYPKYIGYIIDDDNQMIYKGIYHFVHNEDFTDCWYVNDNDSSDKFECLYNERLYKDEGKKEYIVNEDNTGQLSRKYYMGPVGDGHEFTVYTVEKSYLISEDGETKIEVELDDNGDVADRDKLEEEHGIIRKIAETYYDFLRYRNPSLYNHLIDLKYNYQNVTATDIYGNTYTKPSDEKRKRIEVICELIVDALEKHFDKKEWRYIFNLIPTANIQNIQSYIMKMVVFFKSWKTQVLDTSVNYIIDDPYNNHVHIIDDMYYNTTFDNLLEKIRPKDYKYFRNHTEYRDPVRFGEKLEMDDVIYEPYEIQFGFAEKLYGHRFDYPSLTSKLNLKDKVGPGEKVELKTVECEYEIRFDSKNNIILP